MTSIDDVMIEITPQVLLKAYACGIFPMAESAEDNALYWIEPERRGILPLDRVHVPRRLARTIRRGGFEVRIDNDFDAVIDGCAAPRAGRRSTWINGRIRKPLCRAVRHEALPYGRSLGGRRADRQAYTACISAGRSSARSMFSKARDASKIALVYLVARLKFGGFELARHAVPDRPPRPLRRDRGWAGGVSAPARGGALLPEDRERRGRRCRLGPRRPLRRSCRCRSLRGGRRRGSRGWFSRWSRFGRWRRGRFCRGGAGASGAGAAAAGASAAGASAAGAAGAAAFCSLPAGATGSFVLQLVSQTSNTGCSTA